MDFFLSACVVTLSKLSAVHPKFQQTSPSSDGG